MKDGSGGPPRSVKEFVRGHSAWVGSVVALSGRASTDRPAGAEIALTYDDGPTPGDTEAVLEALAEAGAVATFFVLLTRAQRQPAMIRTVASAGHEVALHGPDHRRLTQFSARQVYRRTRDARRRLEDLLQRPVHWIRPPYGAQGPTGYAAVRAAGMEPVMWSASLHDTRTMPWSERTGIVDGAIRPGAIVLAHDGYADGGDGVDDGPAPDLDRGRLAREVLERVRERSLVPVTVAQAAERGGLVRRAWFGGR
jgi:peptidoglycan/xylan/chitin deacetylase (PgdA/CDA1 family)